MSLLLEALRKSERRRQRSAPTIHDPGDPDPSTSPASLPWVPMACCLLAFALMNLFTLVQFRGGEGMASEEALATVELPASPAEEGSAPPAGAMDVEPVTDAKVSAGPTLAPVEVVVTDSQAEEAAPRAAPPVTAAAEKNRTPVESLPAQKRIISGRPRAEAQDLDTASLQKLIAADAEREAGPSEQGRQPAAQPKSKPTPKPKPKPAAPDRPTPRPDAARQKQQQQQRVTPPPRPPSPPHIDYWDLPDNVRQQLPEFRINVLVYAEEPANRFILMGGFRLAEGDSAQEGLVLEEVLRDGAVFSYRRYRFLVHR